jgi:hypothetical protein
VQGAPRGGQADGHSLLRKQEGRFQIRAPPRRQSDPTPAWADHPSVHREGLAEEDLDGSLMSPQRLLLEEEEEEEEGILVVHTVRRLPCCPNPPSPSPPHRQTLATDSDRRPALRPPSQTL